MCDDLLCSLALSIVGFEICIGIVVLLCYIAKRWQFVDKHKSIELLLVEATSRLHTVRENNESIRYAIDDLTATAHSTLVDDMVTTEH